MGMVLESCQQNCQKYLLEMVHHFHSIYIPIYLQRVVAYYIVATIELYSLSPLCVGIPFIFYTVNLSYKMILDGI